MAKRMRFKGVKHTSKRLEEELLERSKSLWSNPGLLRPKCAGNCRKCKFDKTFKKISNLDKIKHDADALSAYASKGSDDIVKAYCGAASLYVAGSIPMLATAKLPDGDVSYVPKGSVRIDKSIGAQYYTDPKLRLMLYSDFAKKKKLYLYSFGDDLVCSDAANMPEDYLYDTFWEAPYAFDDESLTCGHDVEGTLVIKIVSLDKEIRICRNCAKDVSTLQFLMSRLVSRNPLDDFQVFVEHKYHNEAESGIQIIGADMMKDYSLGKITDAGVIGSVLKDKVGALKSSDVATYIIGTENYGSDLDRFLGALSGNEHELGALKSFLGERNESVILRNPKASEALTVLWSNYHDIIASYTSEETADSMGDVSRMNPSLVIADASYRYLSSKTLSELPTFKRLGPIGTYMDIYAKAAKVGGADMLAKQIEKNSPRDTKSWAVARAFVMAVTGAEAPGRYTEEEKEFTEYLVPFAKALVECKPSEYKDKMNTFLTACSCGERV